MPLETVETCKLFSSNGPSLKMGLVPFYLKDLIIPYYSNSTLNSQTAGFLVVPRASTSRMGRPSLVAWPDI